MKEYLRDHILMSHVIVSCERGFACEGLDSGRKSCSPGKYAPNSGSVRYFTCSPGKYSDQNASEAYHAPVGGLQVRRGSPTVADQTPVLLLLEVLQQ